MIAPRIASKGAMLARTRRAPPDYSPTPIRQLVPSLRGLRTSCFVPSYFARTPVEPPLGSPLY